MTRTETAKAIERVSQEVCIQHLGYTPDTWYTGGTSHNDDRLTARVTAEGIRVSDSGTTEIYDGPRTMKAVREYVADWLSMVWA
ncbi:MAG TPA: hypothetical protein VFC10_15945 [Terriglobia bacterium]|jgi:hypothetical protein|nr:hypothetical protein [Terriglobia bacterium]